MSTKWPTVCLGEVLTERQEIPLSEDLVSGRIKVISKISFDTGQIQVRPDSETKTGMILIRPGDLVVSGINAAKGAIAIYGEDKTQPIAATIHYGAYILDLKRVSVQFLWWMLRSVLFRDLLAEYLPGGVKTELKAKRLLPIPIPLPPLEEQRRIVEQIEALASQINDARILRQQTVEETEAFVRSRISQVIEQKMESESWKVTFLPDFVSPIRHAIKRGPFGSHLRKEFFVPSGYKVYEQKHAIYGDFTAGSYYITEEKFNELKSFEINPGDLIISCSGTIGKVAIIPNDAEPGIINQALLKITLDTSKMYRRFFKLVFESDFMKEEVAAISPGSAMKNIGSVRILKRIRFPLPPLDEQRDIIMDWDALQTKVDSLRLLQSQTASELDSLLPSILGHAFRGDL